MQTISLAAASLTLSLVALTIWDAPGNADGALAVGEPANVAKQGFAYGASLNKGSEQEASVRALDTCRTAKIAGKAAKALCKVVRNFKDECVAIALDPKDGTPGAGYAVAPNRRSAETRALSECQKTAGSARREFCNVVASECDGSAN